MDLICCLVVLAQDLWAFCRQAKWWPSVMVTLPWISTTPGAEAWALLIVLHSSAGRLGIVTDCLGNVYIIRNGKERATHAFRPLARLWGLIFSALDDTGAEVVDAGLTWMPAHTALHQVGVALRSDGKPISALDRRANGLADALTKHATEQHRVPPRTRRSLQEATEGIVFAAALAGVTCMAANNHRQSIMHPDGTTSVQVCRNAASLRATALPRAKHKCEVASKALDVALAASCSHSAASSGDVVPRAE